MSDEAIIEGLIARDNDVTRQFFFEQCQPLFRSIIRLVFSYKVDYDEFVSELYQELMKDDARKLRSFEFRCSLMGWLKTVAIRHFICKRDELIEDVSKETLYEEGEQPVEESLDQIATRVDLVRLLCMMENKRYVYVIQKLVLEDVAPEQLAMELGITTANLYNIKKRAMASLTRLVLNDSKK